MQATDWSEPGDYAYTGTHDAARWAWEFLRRNPEYRRDWQWFNDTWQRLEARYGSPPERDFQAWKHDPEAYRTVDDASGECRVDRDRVLIECWMGEKWGFYKFPLDPALPQPPDGEAPSWRAVEEPVVLVGEGDSQYLGQQPARVALGFDLDMPLRAQLEAARGFLQRTRAGLRRRGGLQLQSVSRCRHDWRIMLRLLDALAQGERFETAVDLLRSQGDAPRDDDFTSLLQRAQQLVDGGYRALLRIPA